MADLLARLTSAVIRVGDGRGFIVKDADGLGLVGGAPRISSSPRRTVYLSCRRAVPTASSKNAHIGRCSDRLGKNEPCGLPVR
jgi:hypothetical protein